MKTPQKYYAIVDRSGTGQAYGTGLDPVRAWDDASPWFDGPPVGLVCMEVTGDSFMNIMMGRNDEWERIGK